MINGVLAQVFLTAGTTHSVGTSLVPDESVVSMGMLSN